MKIEDIAEITELLKLIRKAPPEIESQFYMITQGAVIVAQSAWGGDSMEHRPLNDILNEILERTLEKIKKEENGEPEQFSALVNSAAQIAAIIAH